MPWNDITSWDDTTIWHDVDELAAITVTTETVIKPPQPPVDVMAGTRYPGEIIISPFAAVDEDIEFGKVIPAGCIFFKIMFINNTSTTGNITLGTTLGGADINAATIAPNSNQVIPIDMFFSDTLDTSVFLSSEWLGQIFDIYFIILKLI